MKLDPAATYRAQPNAFGRFRHFPRDILTPTFVASCVEDRDGIFFWRERADDFFRNDRGRNAWNSIIAGRAISLRKNPQGYRFITLCGYEIKAHHLVWVFHTGKWPAGEIDHINGVRDDNRVENLRDVTRAINSRNRALRCDNTAGYPGIEARDGRWRALLTIDGKTRFLGSFGTKGAAIAARRAAEANHGFTERHGEAA